MAKKKDKKVYKSELQHELMHGVHLVSILFDTAVDKDTYNNVRSPVADALIQRIRADLYSLYQETANEENVPA